MWRLDGSRRFIIPIPRQAVGVDLKLNHRINSADELKAFDEVVLATGVIPLTPPIEGIEHSNVLSYVDVLRGQANVGSRVAVIGAGGIGFDIAEYLSHDGNDSSVNPLTFMKEWGIDTSFESVGGVTDFNPKHQSIREVTLLQRKHSKVGENLGKSTGWIHRRSLTLRGVTMIKGCE